LAFSKKALPYWGGLLLLVFVAWLVFRDNSKKLRAQVENITINAVTQGQFNDYIRISGQVVPMTPSNSAPWRRGGAEGCHRGRQLCT